MKLVHGLILLVAAVVVFGEDFPEEDSVLVLGEDNFDKALAAFQHVLVEFCKLITTCHSVTAVTERYLSVRRLPRVADCACGSPVVLLKVLLFSTGLPVRACG